MTPPPPRTPPGAKLLLAIGSVLSCFLLLAGIEGALRLTGIGAPDESRASRLKYQQVLLPVLEPATRADGSEMLRSADQRLPYQEIQREKPEAGLRILVFGGSATAGLGYSPNVTFARELARLLRAAEPARPIEVANLGIVALSSRQVKVSLADAVARYAPDVVLVYSGNNEFLELHAEKYALAHDGVPGRIAWLLRDTNLYRALDRGMRGPPRVPSQTEQDFSSDDLRLTQREIVRDVHLSPEEIEAISDSYEANFEAMIDAATAAGTRIVLMTVASNWKWRGRQDLPEDWSAEVLEGPPPLDADGWRRVQVALGEALESARPEERSELLFRRAVAGEALGDFAAARDDYRAAMNEDPHLRRALDAMNERVRAVAERRDVPLLDVVEVLASQSEHGIVGFEAFYDYVHFTPRGALLVAVALRDLIVSLGVANLAGVDTESYRRARLDELEALEEDPIFLDEWLGFGFDRSLLADRDLWKYERMVADLDARLAKDPGDARALAYRGNARYFRSDGGAEAERDYRAALELAPQQPGLRANLERLLSEARRELH